MPRRYVHSPVSWRQLLTGVPFPHMCQGNNQDQPSQVYSLSTWDTNTTLLNNNLSLFVSKIFCCYCNIKYLKVPRFYKCQDFKSPKSFLKFQSVLTLGSFWIKISEVFFIPKGKNRGIKAIAIKLNKVQQCRSRANILGSLIIFWASKVLCGSPFQLCHPQNIQQYCMLRMALLHTWYCFVVTPRFCHPQYPDIATATECTDHSPITSVGHFSETLPLPISVKAQQHLKVSFMPSK